jgi:hypothetical protein
MNNRDELRLEFRKNLADKLAKKLNADSIKHLPWSEMTAGDIINWPREVEFRTVDKMSTKELKSLQELAKNDQLDFTTESINRLKIKGRVFKNNRNELRSEMIKYLSKKLAQRLNVQSIKKLPWSEMTEGDIINWPQGLEFKRFDIMNTEEVKKIHEHVKEDDLDFAQEFIGRLKIELESTKSKDKPYLTKYLRDKLAKKLSVDSIRVPWSQMRAKDIINWPQQVEFKSFREMNTKELKKIHELVKEDKLDFSHQFISRLKNIKKRTNANKTY